MHTGDIWKAKASTKLGEITVPKILKSSLWLLNAHTGSMSLWYRTALLCSQSCKKQSHDLIPNAPITRRNTELHHTPPVRGMAGEGRPPRPHHLQLSHIPRVAFCAQPPLWTLDPQACQQEGASVVGLAGYFIPSETCLENPSFFQELLSTC